MRVGKAPLCSLSESTTVLVGNMPDQQHKEVGSDTATVFIYSSGMTSRLGKYEIAM